MSNEFRDLLVAGGILIVVVLFVLYVLWVITMLSFFRKSYGRITAKDVGIALASPLIVPTIVFGVLKGSQKTGGLQ